MANALTLLSAYSTIVCRILSLRTQLIEGTLFRSLFRFIAHSFWEMILYRKCLFFFSSPFSTLSSTCEIVEADSCPSLVCQWSLFPDYDTIFSHTSFWNNIQGTILISAVLEWAETSIYRVTWKLCNYFVPWWHRFLLCQCFHFLNRNTGTCRPTYM